MEMNNNQPNIEIKDDNYSVSYDPKIPAITFTGSLRLNGIQEYQPIVELLHNVIDTNPERITLNLQSLNFLNSSGINILSKFTIKIRKQKTIHLVIQASEAIPWQTKSLKNLKRLLPSLELEIQ